jgi:hypothetical protein
MVWKMTERQAAELFAEQIRQRNLTAWNLYKAGVLGKKPKYTRIKDVVEKYGYKVGRHAGDGLFTAIAALRRLLDMNAIRGEHAFKIAADICNPTSIPGEVLTAIFAYELHMGEIAPSELEKLRLAGKTGIRCAIHEKAAVCNKGKMNADIAGQAILEILNRGRSSRRRSWKK